MRMAIAVETYKHPSKKQDYKVWYLEINDQGDVIGIGTKTREQLVQSVFQNYRKTGHSNWRAFTKHSEQSKEIELYDFISQGSNENTHFGNLPTIAEFQETLNYLQMNLEVRAVS